jgi:hypothetical protein
MRILSLITQRSPDARSTSFNWFRTKIFVMIALAAMLVAEQVNLLLTKVRSFLARTINKKILKLKAQRGRRRKKI